MTTTIKSTVCKHLEARIVHDDCPSNPREEYDCLGKISYASRARTVLGDTPATSEEDDAIERGLRTGKLIGLPVWAYVHSGVRLAACETNPFHCQWDSGRSGYVYTTREEVLQEFGGKRMTAAIREKALKVLIAEVEVFSKYLDGDCYGFTIIDTTTDECVDSCWGFYGSDDAEESARSALAQMEELETA